MPLSEDRTLAQISIQAKEHMKAILISLQATGLPITGTYWLSELILSLLDWRKIFATELLDEMIPGFSQEAYPQWSQARSM